MHRTVRIVLGGAVFLGVSILSAVEQAPYIQLGDDAEAGDAACRIRCNSSLPVECKRSAVVACLDLCDCSGGAATAKACTASNPCPQTDDSKSACIAGLCVTRCSNDADCRAAGGGVCKTGACRRRTADEASSCKGTCDQCKERAGKCREKFNACAKRC